MRIAAVMALAAAFAAGCGGNGGGNAIDVQGDEYAFVMPDEAEGGVVTFNVSNVGDEFHEFAFVRIGEGKTLEDVQALIAAGVEDPPEWLTDVGGVPLLSPGEELALTRELEPATYVFLCFLPSPQGEPHVALGMVKTLELTGNSESDLPEPDAVISATGSGYDIPPIEAGRQTIELRNADEREREFFLVALEPGKTLADLDRFFEEGEQSGAAPATFRGAMQTIPAGTSVFVELDLEEGTEYTLSDTSGDEPVVATFTPT